MKKLIVLALLATIMLSGCGNSDNGAEATTPVTAPTTTAATTTTEATTTAPETEATTQAEIERPEYFTIPAEGQTSLSCLTYEKDKGVWAHLVNPYNANALYQPAQESDFFADAENITICFEASGVTSEIDAFCGISAYGLGEDDEEISCWNKDSFKRLTGEDFSFIIDKDGAYEMVVPIAKMAAGLDFWEGLKTIYIIEPVFYGAQAVDADGKYLDALYDGLKIEFTGIKIS